MAQEVGRPQHFTKEQIYKMVEDLKEYIEEEEDPTIVGFTSEYPAIFSETLGRDTYINKDFINNHDEFCELRKKAIEKQESYIVKGVTKNQLNATMGVFRLKQPQHGYTDKQEIDQKTTLNVVGEVLNDIGLTRPDLTNDRKGTN